MNWQEYIVIGLSHYTRGLIVGLLHVHDQFLSEYNNNSLTSDAVIVSLVCVAST